MTDWSDLDTDYLAIFGDHPALPLGAWRRAGEGVLVGLPAQTPEDRPVRSSNNSSIL